MLLFVVCAAATLGAADWPQWRGVNRDNHLHRNGPVQDLARRRPEGAVEDHRSPRATRASSIKAGRLYINDYDTAKKEHLIRCLSLADGKEVWRWSYPVDIRPNHGITRTVPSVGNTLVFSLDPKCRFHALDIKTGKLVWQKNLVQDYKATIPGWYAGQNPLLDGDRVVLATGGDALAVAFDQATGKEIWKSPNPGKDLMSHASLMPATIGGVKQYLYMSREQGRSGSPRRTGRLLWSIPFATKMAGVPSPVSIGDGRVFITSGYEAGSMMIQVEKGASGFTVKKLYDLTSAAVQLRSAHAHPLQEPPVRRRLEDARPVHVRRPRRQGGLAEPGRRCGHAPRTFDLGGYIFADGMFFVTDGEPGMLRLIEANTTGYKELASAQVLSGEDVWGPLAISDRKLVLRDMSQLICLQVGPAGAK